MDLFPGLLVILGDAQENLLVRFSWSVVSVHIASHRVDHLPGHLLIFGGTGAVIITDYSSSNNNNNTSRVDDQLTTAKGNTPAREISPFRGKGLDQLTLALPYPSSPALGRKDTTYAWSYRLRSP